tara:strand:+ start:238 stop:780 length:543 start_codon:yes stop_codon:yes gene_type:complete
MKIREFIIAPKESKDTTSCDTTSSIVKGELAQDIVPQNIVPEKELALEVDSIEEHDDHSAITEGVSQILRRSPGVGLKKGFRCTSGPRKGRIVAKPSTCFAKRDPVKGAKIKKKRQAKARTAGKKLGITKRSKGVSRRLKGVQVKQKKSSLPTYGAISSRKPLQRSGGKKIKSKIVKPKK